MKNVHVHVVFNYLSWSQLQKGGVMPLPSPPIFRNLSVDNYFKDDLTVILLLCVSLMVKTIL